MPIGSSDGKYYEDDFDRADNRFIKNPEDPSVIGPEGATEDKNELHPETIPTPEMMERMEFSAQKKSGYDPFSPDQNLPFKSPFKGIKTVDDITRKEWEDIDKLKTGEDLRFGRSKNPAKDLEELRKTEPDMDMLIQRRQLTDDGSDYEYYYMYFKRIPGETPGQEVPMSALGNTEFSAQKRGENSPPADSDLSLTEFSSASPPKNNDPTLLPGYSPGGGGGSVPSRGGKTKLEQDILEFRKKNNLGEPTKEQTIGAIKLRIGQIERDRRGSKVEGEKYPPNGELSSLRARLKELQAE